MSNCRIPCPSMILSPRGITRIHYYGLSVWESSWIAPSISWRYPSPHQLIPRTGARPQSGAPQGGRGSGPGGRGSGAAVAAALAGTPGGGGRGWGAAPTAAPRAAPEAPKPIPVPTEDFDFDAMFRKFKKEEIKPVSLGCSHDALLAYEGNQRTPNPFLGCIPTSCCLSCCSPRRQPRMPLVMSRTISSISSRARRWTAGVWKSMDF